MANIELHDHTGFDTGTLGHKTTATGAVMHGAGAIGAAVRDWLARRRTAAMLRDLSDAELADIGLMRADVPSVAWRDRSPMSIGPARGKAPDMLFDYPLL